MIESAEENDQRIKHYWQRLNIVQNSAKGQRSRFIGIIDCEAEIKSEIQLQLANEQISYLNEQIELEYKRLDNPNCFYVDQDMLGILREQIRIIETRIREYNLRNLQYEREHFLIVERGI